MTISLPKTTPACAETNLGNIVSVIAQSFLVLELVKKAYVGAQNVNIASVQRDYIAKLPEGLHRVNVEQALTRLADLVDALGTPSDC